MRDTHTHAHAGPSAQKRRSTAPLLHVRDTRTRENNTTKTKKKEKEDPLSAVKSANEVVFPTESKKTHAGRKEGKLCEPQITL